jgi:hypothetical protein
MHRNRQVDVERGIDPDGEGTEYRSPLAGEVLTGKYHGLAWSEQKVD